MIDCFIERRQNNRKRIATSIQPIFTPLNTSFSGTISELSQKEAKIILDEKSPESLEPFLEKHFFLSFKFSKSHRPVLTQATPVRIDDHKDNRKKLVFRFFRLEKDYKNVINSIINVYGVPVTS
ncbi:MAG TPA: PilZ domain-containing protein [Spirochaetes bacterium]|nr:PilZ domain-containing protein [Spirochaetota bacterium]